MYSPMAHSVCCHVRILTYFWCLWCTIYIQNIVQLILISFLQQEGKLLFQSDAYAPQYTLEISGEEELFLFERTVYPHRINKGFSSAFPEDYQDRPTPEGTLIKNEVNNFVKYLTSSLAGMIARLFPLNT